MKISRRIVRVALLVLVAFAIIEGTINMVRWRGVPLVLAEKENAVLIKRVLRPEDNIRLLPGDALLAIGGQKISDLSEASWKLGEMLPGTEMIVTVARGDTVFKTQITADHSLPLGYMILDRLTGLVFLALGFLVGWRGPREVSVQSFFRVNMATGIAVLLLRSENPYVSQWLGNLHGVTYLLVHYLVPAFLADFVFVYTHEKIRSNLLVKVRWLLFAPVVLLAVATAGFFILSERTQSSYWIRWFDLTHRQVFTILLSVVVLTIAAWMVQSYLAAKQAWDRTRYRWLLLCTLAGICPYAFLDRFPTLLGMNPLLPQGLSISLLLDAPLGWGMAVASFHMLDVEWKLSRTVVYFAAAGIVLYAGVSFSAALAGLTQEGSIVSEGVLWLLGLALAVLAAISMVGPVQRWVDRLYYGDWFDARRAVRTISLELASVFQRSQLEVILAGRLPKLLQLEKCQLWTPDHGRSVSAFGSNADVHLLRDIPGAADLIVFSVHDHTQFSEFQAGLPLIHAGKVNGYLLLGAKSSGAPYSLRDRELLRSLSSVAGIALANIELNERLLDQERRVVVSELAGGIAHEIKNALSPLMGRAQLLERMSAESQMSDSAEVLQESTRVISSMCQRIRRIADNLNDLTKPLTVEFRSVQLQSIADEALSILSETAGRIRRFQELDTEAPFQLRRRYDPAVPTAYADPDLILQVYLNLIVNACDAMANHKSGSLIVGTQWLPESHSVVGFVEDTGDGIPVESLDRIFLPYFTTKPEGKGTGLGLSMVRTIVDAHRGTISVSSAPGRGTRFVFSIPRNQNEIGGAGEL